MKPPILAATALLFAMTPFLPAADAPSTPKDKLSYSIGVVTAKQMQQGGLDINPQVFAQGLTDALASSKLLLSDADIQQTLGALQAEMQAKAEAKQKEVEAQQKAEQANGPKNLEAGTKFLADNAKKDGVKTTASGLQYRVVTEGKGDKPKATDKVTVNYKGTLIDGTEFDSSYKRGEPATFGVDQVIPGWTEALQLMPIGSKWQLTIPAKLAYGEQGPPGIGPNQVLVFEVELLKIAK